MSSTPKPQAIFFDLGMVLVTFDWNIAIPRFVARSGANAARVREFIAAPIHQAFERGEISSTEFFRVGRAQLDFHGSPDEFKDFWNEIFDEVPEAIHLARQLAQTYPLYLISNTNVWHAEYLEARCAWMNVFAQRFYSYVLGVRKPDPRIYRAALQSANVMPTRALFIDDRLENLDGARAFGMQTLHAPTFESLYLKLRHLFAGNQRSPIFDSPKNHS